MSYRTQDISNGWHFFSKNGLFKGETNLPTSNYLDLMRCGYIKDPFKGKNESELFWVSEIDWFYTKTFDIDSETLNSERVYLCFDSVDTIADIILNGEVIASCDNTHKTYRIDVKHKLVNGENRLKVYFYSPVEYIKEKLKKFPVPPNFNGVNGFTLIRKAAYQFGWDWGPCFPSSGFDKGVHLDIFSGAYIDNLRVEQQTSEEVADVSVVIETDTEAQTDVTASLYSPEGKFIASKAAEKIDTTQYRATFSVKNPELWWANGQTDRTEQPLYRIDVTADDHARTVKIGLREVRLLTAPDKEGADFCFAVNGKRIFAKGGNWIPADSFVARVSRERYGQYVKNMQWANFNM
ncbi:MAG: hypothetical protein LBN25_01335, partial [Christensenellaceae bacterium]|nr:hypothetical protein [Christensenellaceae bacterium]